LATIHANSAVEALSRLEDLIGEVTQRVPYRAIAQAINLVVFIERTPSGRQVRSVTRVVGRDGEGYRLEEVKESTPRGPGDMGLSALLG
jgi:type IV secretion system protein VirB11